MRHDYILRNNERILRPVTLNDAAFIGRLRTQVGTGIVNDTDPDVAVQRRWLEAYFERPGDIYWIIETPGGEPVVEKWVQADADGNLPEPLTAPKAGASGFYRVIVTDNPQK